MNVELHPVDAELIRMANKGRPLSPYALSKYRRIRERLLLMGSAGAMSKELIAQILEVSLPDSADSPSGIEEPEVAVTGPSEAEAIADPEVGMYPSGPRDTEYRGKHFTQVKPAFESRPGDPWSKVEKGRPLLYVSDKDGARHVGRFVKIDPKDSKRIIIQSDEMRRNFGVPAANAELTDLSPLSTTPLPVQI